MQSVNMEVRHLKLNMLLLLVWSPRVSEEAKLWHLRLDHLPFSKLHHVCLVHSTNKCENTICQVCQKAR